MNFDLKEEHRLINDAIERVLQDTCSAEDLRAPKEQPGESRWSALHSLGVAGLLIPEELGGLAENELALVTLGQTCGKYALPEPVLESMAVCAPVLSMLGKNGSGFAEELLEQVLSGERRLAVYDPQSSCNTISAQSDGVLFRQQNAWKFIDGHTSQETILPSLDNARSSFYLDENVKGLLLGELEAEFVSLTSQRGTLAASSELLGLGSRLLEMTVEYTKIREQFGKPIAGFQAIQHKLADVWTALRFATPVLNRAAWAVSEGCETSGLHVSHAKIACGSAADHSAKAAIQVFGAMGYTYESDLHFWLKRVWAVKDHWGGRVHHEQNISLELAKPENRGPGATFPHRLFSAR